MGVFVVGTPVDNSTAPGGIFLAKHLVKLSSCCSAPSNVGDVVVKEIRELMMKPLLLPPLLLVFAHAFAIKEDLSIYISLASLLCLRCSIYYCLIEAQTAKFYSISIYCCRINARLTGFFSLFSPYLC